MIVLVECACHIWPIKLGSKVKECGGCGQTPHKHVDGDGPAVCLHDGPCRSPYGYTTRLSADGDSV